MKLHILSLVTAVAFLAGLGTGIAITLRIVSKSAPPVVRASLATPAPLPRVHVRPEPEGFVF